MHDVAPPLVSVVMPVRDARQFLREAIHSILEQTFSDFELLLIDDFSQDDSAAICQSYCAADSRVVLLHNTERGIIGALNFGIAHARGKLIARMDADDICEPDRFARFREEGLARGFRFVESSPLVRSSYHAERHVH